MTTGKKVKDILKNEDFVTSSSKVAITQGTALRILREKNGFSQNKLAELTGLTQSTLSSIENDRINIGIERAKTLARVLNVHPAVLAFPDWEIAA